ncbi:DciA family protein [Agitococcus lubricus]|uniref:DUF721 domain-containing protein n=1 Tax=Agitococcus lubricus TaxID=1077255 RepID=A0A2T5J0J1_9GAMM|nr:DciA family protein [Agitococcus lubricus]PTQ89864.1 hypothetical protein C8N29_105192 [Agitococcus lubricus]
MAISLQRSRDLKGSPLLLQLQQQALYLAKLNAIVAEQLTAIKDHCRVASYKDGILTLQTTNNALSGQLRYLHNHYLQKLRQHTVFSGILRIQILLAASIDVNRAQSEAVTPLSPQTRSLLLETASHIEDAELSEALRSLAR